MGVSGTWFNTRVYNDPTPSRSAGVNPAHLQGSLAPGRAPIQGPPTNIPIVVEQPQDWDTWGDGSVPGWERLGNTDTESHQAYEVDSGVPETVAVAEGNAYRSQDMGAVDGRLRGLSAYNDGAETHITSQTSYSQVDDGTFNESQSVLYQRQAKGAAINNPEGLERQITPRIQRWSTRKFPQPFRTHDQHALRDRRAMPANSAKAVEGDQYGSPFDSDVYPYPSGNWTPTQQRQPQLWDQSVLDQQNQVNDPTITSEDEMGSDW